MGEISMQRYFLNHINSFSLVKFYENYEFETQQDGEYAIKGVLDALRKKRDGNGKLSSRLGKLIEMIEKNDYEVNDANMCNSKLLLLNCLYIVFELYSSTSTLVKH
jgi:hypothetical protein